MYGRDKATVIFPCVYQRFHCAASPSDEIKNGRSSTSTFSVDLFWCRRDTLPLVQSCSVCVYLYIHSHEHSNITVISNI
jgi:hypothetical protein